MDVKSPLQLRSNRLDTTVTVVDEGICDIACEQLERNLVLEIIPSRDCRVLLFVSGRGCVVVVLGNRMCLKYFTFAFF